MADYTNAELIATAKAMREQLGDDYPKPGSILALWFETADALEAAEQRAEQAEAEVEGMLSDSTRWMNRALPAEQRAAEYAAVVEKAEDFVTRHHLDTTFGEEVLPILASAGADVLRKHDAELIDGLADWMEGIRANADVCEAVAFVPGERGRQEVLDRAELMHDEPWAILREAARQRREEQDHG